mmetsp:Transcript_12241/g.18333  ORF Transcript_12241/g.18333 Transcript_12241/m.18333 type:complete len:167 (-) Transcript_12241:30-530(-)
MTSSRQLKIIDDPNFDTFESAQNKIDQLFDHFTRTFMDLSAPQTSFPTKKNIPRVYNDQILNIDLKELEDRYEIKIDIPGVEKESIKLFTDKNDNSIKVEVNRKRNFEGDCMINECPSGKLHRLLHMPRDANVESTQAKYKNGELSLAVEKFAGKSTEKGKMVNIE